MMTEDSPLTVAGAAAVLSDCSPALRSLLIPEGNRHRNGTLAYAEINARFRLHAGFPISVLKRQRKSVFDPRLGSLLVAIAESR
jgi:hypothetical protein